MLPKRSTSVDQNLGYESRHSQLSVVIFRALRNRLVTQKSLMYFQTCQKHGNPCIPPPRVSKTRDISRQKIYISSSRYIAPKCNQKDGLIKGSALFRRVCMGVYIPSIKSQLKHTLIYRISFHHSWKWNQLDTDETSGRYVLARNLSVVQGG